jgi:hypothetical protein
MVAYKARMDFHHEEMLVLMKASLGKTMVRMESGQERI